MADYPSEHAQVATLLGGTLGDIITDCDGPHPHMRILELPDGSRWVVKLRSSGKIDPGQECMLELLQWCDSGIAPPTIRAPNVNALALIYGYMGDQTLDRVASPCDRDIVEHVYHLVLRENRLLWQHPRWCSSQGRFARRIEGVKWMLQRIPRWGIPLVRLRVVRVGTLVKIAIALLPYLRTVQLVDKNIIGKHIVMSPSGGWYPVDWTPVVRPRLYPLGRFLAWGWLKRLDDTLDPYEAAARRFKILPLFAFSLLGIGWDLMESNESSANSDRKLRELGQALRTWNL
jgi:hypothetical protein